jgi:hypothetical protein
MPVSPHNITAKLDFVNPLQYVGEGDTEATPANYGVPPTNPTYSVVGNNIRISPIMDCAHSDILGLGTEDILDDSGIISRAYSLSFTYNPINITLLKYIWNPSAAGTVNPRESLSFMYSYKLNGTTYYRYIRGFRPTSATFSVQRGVWEAEISGVAKDITTPATTEQDPGTPVYASAETASAAIKHTDGGGSPFTLGGVNYGERRFSISVTRGVAIMDVNGEADIVYTKLNDRRITWSADVFIGTASSETALETAYKAKTKLAMSYKFNSVGPVTFTTANNVLTGYTETKDAGNTDAIIASVSGRSESGTAFA